MIQAGDKRKCNARCYDAAEVRKHCKCACGGANHGVRLTQALKNTEALKGDWIVFVPTPAQVEAEEQIGLFECV